MARNEEKAMAMLNRWVKMKRGLNTVDKGKRPARPEECGNVAEADNWRKQIVRELIKKVSDIQNASLGEHRIRDLNDEINGLLREKTRWEEHIREMGGPDYKSAAIALQMETADGGVELAGQTDGYKYFGAAKNLPKVRELF